MDHTRRNRLAMALILLLSVVLNLLLWQKGEVIFLYTMWSKIGALSLVTVVALSICCYLYRRAARLRHALYNSQVEHDSHYTNSDAVTLTRGSKALYKQPWYLLIGADGAGKTALSRQETGLAVFDG